MPFQMPQIENNIGNALAGIGQMRQQRTQNALAERQIGLSEAAGRRQQQQFDAEQAATQRAQMIETTKGVLGALARVPQAQRQQAFTQLAGDLPPEFVQRMSGNPDAFTDQNIALALNRFGTLTPDQLFGDQRREAQARDMGPTYTYRDTDGEVVAFNNRDPSDIRGTGRRPKPPAPPAPPAVIYQAAPANLVDPSTGQPVLGRFNPRTGAYERADVPSGLVPAAQPDRPMTEGQSKALIFGSRMRESNAIMDQLAEAGVSALPLGYRAASEVPLLGAAVSSNARPEVQMLDQAQRDWLNAVLRRESGAVISEQEFENGARQYFPVPGEDPRTTEQKRRNRMLAEQGVLAEVPEGRRDSVGPNARPAQSRVPKISSEAEWRALPKGTRYVDPSGVERVKN